MNRREYSQLLKLAETLQDVFDTLESTTDSDLDFFEDDEEEREAAPVQYAARKTCEVRDKLWDMVGKYAV